MNDLTQEELWHMRALIQRIGWGKFMRHVGSLMAEQADKVQRDSEQDHNLFQCSNTIHALDPFFQKCGYFDYRKMGGLIPAEHAAVPRQNRGVRTSNRRPHGDLQWLIQTGRAFIYADV